MELQKRPETNRDTDILRRRGRSDKVVTVLTGLGLLAAYTFSLLISNAICPLVIFSELSFKANECIFWFNFGIRDTCILEFIGLTT